MKKKLLTVTLAMMTVTTMLTACGSDKKSDDKSASKESSVVVTSEPVGDGPVGEFNEPMNWFEERVGKTSFESYDEIIGLLEGDEAYAYVEVKGYDGKVLMISDYSYDYGDGVFATTEASIYSMKPSGVCTGDSIFLSGGTGSPVAIDDAGIIYTANHREVGKQCYGNNGTDIPAIMYMESVACETIEEDGTPVNITGFIRTNNDLINDDIKDIENDDVAAWNKAYDDYFSAHPVNFTKANN